MIWLREIDFSKNALKDLSEDILGLKNLQVLNLNSNQFETIPPIISDFAELKVNLLKKKKKKKKQQKFIFVRASRF